MAPGSRMLTVYQLWAIRDHNVQTEAANGINDPRVECVWEGRMRTYTPYRTVETGPTEYSVK